MLKDPTFRSCGDMPSPPTSARDPNYDSDQLYRAYEAVREGASIRSAAQMYGVPKSTLNDRVTGRVQFGAHSGPERYLTDEEEK